MSYEFNQEKDLTLANPFKVENLFLAFNGGVFVLLGLICLWQVRSHFGLASPLHSFFALIMGLAVLSLGGYWLAQCLSQLKFYFGRGRPLGLAPEINTGAQGKSASSDKLKETLRHQSLEYSEPKGALEGLLYALVPKLIYAPTPLKGLAATQFHNAIAFAVLLLGLIMATLLTGGKTEAVRQSVDHWIGLAFFAYTLYTAGFGRNGARMSQQQHRQQLTVNSFVGLAAFVILGPLLFSLLASALPSMQHYSPYPQVYILLLGGLISYALYFVAIIKQLPDAPQTLVNHQQDAWHLNCHPGLILGELDRELQKRWVCDAPNRLYSRLEPHIDLNEKTGRFNAEMLQETQPIPEENRPLSLSSTWMHPQARYLLLLNGLASLSMLCATLGGLWFIQALLTKGAAFPMHLAGYTTTFLSIGLLGSHMAHGLWQRVDFKSRLILLELEGQYTCAQLQQGRLLQDSLQTSSQLIKIESMTFRIWHCNLNSVVFGKDAERYPVALTGEESYLNTLVQQLKSFAQNQAILVAPTSAVDAERQQINQQFNTEVAEANQSSNTPLPMIDSSLLEQPHTPEPNPRLNKAQFCSQCGKPINPHDRFCPHCGHHLIYHKR